MKRTSWPSTDIVPPLPLSRFSETISTLRFGTRAKFIKNKPRVHVGYGGTEKDELLRKRDMEIARLKDQIAELTSTMTQVSRENECFRQTYGDLPEEALTSMAADDGGGGGEREDGAGAKPVAREAKLPRQFQRSLEYARLLEAEVFTIGTEARLVRHATEEVRTRIVTQRDVFGEARFAVSKLVSGFASAPEQRREAHAEEVRERGREVEEILAMARWRSEDVLRGLQLLARAALAIEIAAKESRAMYNAVKAK